jgi:tetratricopeptide (TPR) repeat protein
MLNWIKQFFFAQGKEVVPLLVSAQSEVSMSSPVRIGESIKDKEQGDALLRIGDFVAAEQCYRRAITKNPDHAKAHNNLGFALREQGLFQEAEHCLLQALAIDPSIADAYYMLGTLCQADERLEAACAHLRKVLELDSYFEFAYIDLCKLLFQLGQLEEAKQIINEGISHIPTNPNLHFYLGNIYHEQNQLEFAVASFQRALLIQPDHAEVLGNLGIVLLKMENLDEAVAAFRKAVQLNQNYPDAYNNLGNALLKQNKFVEAMECYETGIVLDRNANHLYYNRGLLSLLIGNFESGWKDYEYRWTQIEQASRPNFSQPLWLNDANISGKIILLHAEQGIGDTLQFVRYVEQVVSLGAKVYLEVHPPLKALLNSLPGVSRVFARGEALPHFDFHCPLASLPLAFNTNFASIPSKTSYLNAPVERATYFADQFREYALPRVGIVWAGGTFFKNDHLRSIKLQTFSKIVIDGNCDFFSLQKDLRPFDTQLLEKFSNIIDIGPQLTDFSETAAIIANLDLVITVDTSVAHLAGALGKPVWILLPFSPDFRWLLDRSDSPWYPSARLFRQPSIGNWDSVMQDVRNALNAQFCNQAS